MAVDGCANEMRAVCLETMHNDTATNPNHGGSTGSAEKCQEARHTENKGTSKCAAHTAGD
jgi:hypothetical protein